MIATPITAPTTALRAIPRLPAAMEDEGTNSAPLSKWKLSAAAEKVGTIAEVGEVIGATERQIHIVP